MLEVIDDDRRDERDARRFHFEQRLDVGPRVGRYRVAGKFTHDASDSIWVGDVAGHRTREDWLRLAHVLDPFQRQVIGWAMDDRRSAYGSSEYGLRPARSYSVGNMGHKRPTRTTPPGRVSSRACRSRWATGTPGRHVTRRPQPAMETP